MINSYIAELKNILENVEREKITLLANKITEVGKSGNKIYIIGNGGSAANASHFACDLSKGTLTRFYDPRQQRLKAISLTDNIAALTALANDLSYDEIFSQQLRNLITKNDILITMTGSGKSKNIINAIIVAKEIGSYIFSLLGFDGGEVAQMSDDHIIIPSENYGIIEDAHLTISHLIMMSIRNGNNTVHNTKQY